MIDDNQVLQALEKMKAYAAMKGRQSQAPRDQGNPVESDLQTIETWGKDTSDSGAAWGQRKQAESQENIKQSEKWQAVVKKDQQDAAADEQFRSKLDLKKIKGEIQEQLSKYVKALQSLGQAGEPGFEQKAAASASEAKAAQKYVDENLEKSLKQTAEKAAGARQRNQRVAAQAEDKANASRQWQQEYGNRPEKLGAGQRADVESALDRVGDAAQQFASELEAFNGKAAPTVAQLRKVQDWAKRLKPKVSTATGPAGASVKADAVAGAGEARTAFKSAAEYQNNVEGEANKSIDLFQRWVAENNRRAREWINSTSEPHKKWAAAWMKGNG